MVHGSIGVGLLVGLAGALWHAPARSADADPPEPTASIASAPGDYVSDCFEIAAAPPGTTLKKDETYFVSGQKEIANDDRELTLVKGRIKWFFGCKPVGDPVQRIAASRLIESGAYRRGWAYGALTMPYKYFPGEKSFVVNAPIGAYLGWRDGQAGSGRTYALAVTLSSVKANVVDPNLLDAAGKPTVTGTADVAALSLAAGAMFDILKSPRGKPFKVGVFVGRDTVSRDPTIDYRYNRKNWVALQIGYDFTDN
jgi:hypothetical protein